ncbi:hypothetical protein AWJ20_573 [Sugiyamaella lignohabitans]|uniref:SWIRM domain-containing protein n=1 Tax=Sugiyamaella lignohabitans TaxID=796027 RepID=A0A167D0C5_9ASCO|nr:uncharacterized protein AWJ20_573 [Sugiyamaella lignohabitans]ANB12323.1 hypothetical protein AWJ20_573 [Sugiyamaella lignohabitans]
MDRRRIALGLQQGLGFEPEFNGLQNTSRGMPVNESGQSTNAVGMVPSGNIGSNGQFLRRSSRKSMSRGSLGSGSGAGSAGNGVIGPSSFDTDLNFADDGIYLSDLEMANITSELEESENRRQAGVGVGRPSPLDRNGLEMAMSLGQQGPITRGRASISRSNANSSQYLDTTGSGRMSIDRLESPDTQPVTSQPLWSLSYDPVTTLDNSSRRSFGRTSDSSASGSRVQPIIGGSGGAVSGGRSNSGGENLTRASGGSVSNTPGGGHETDSSNDEFLSFAGESQQQRRSLLLQQQMTPYDNQPQQIRFPTSNSVMNYDQPRGRSRVSNSSMAQQQQQQQQQQQRQQNALLQQLDPLQSHMPHQSLTQSHLQNQNQRIVQPQYQRVQPLISVPVRSSSVDSRNQRPHNMISAGHIHQRQPRYPSHPHTEQHSHSTPYYDREGSGSGDEQTQQVRPEDPISIRRKKYKPKSSIPPDLSSSNYAEQCAAAAISSRLNPYRLHVDEYNILRSHLSYVHVTTYLNIRNGILRLWLSNPIVKVTMFEAAGCARDERFYGLAEFAYEWLVRNGYINFGCLEYPLSNIEQSVDYEHPLKPRPTIVIIGAGIAGLGCARQLDSLLNRYAQNFTGEYEDIPRIIVLEGRRRIGGRIYSAPLKSDHNCMVDLGAQIIMGYGDGNPLGVLVRRQLGLPILPMDPPSGLCDSVNNEQVPEEIEDRAHRLYGHLLKKMAQFKNGMPEPSTVQGDEVLMNAAKDPSTRDEFQESQTIAKLEENGELPKPYEDPGFIDEGSKYGTDEQETQEEFKFLKSIGIDSKKISSRKTIHVAPEPQGEMYPSLGETLTGLLGQLNELAQLTPQDIRLVNWYLANLEYSTGTNLNNLSLSSWNQDDGHDFSGRHSVIRNGYMSLPRGLYVYPEKLDVRFKTSVKVIEYHDDYSDVFLENGEKIQADRVIVTVPLGILKDRTIQFIPDLPQWKTDSIERLGFGVTNKVCILKEGIKIGSKRY